MSRDELAAGGDGPAGPSQVAELEDGLSSPLQPLISSRSTLSVEEGALGSSSALQQQPWAGGKAAAADGDSASAGCPSPRAFAWVSTH